LHDSPGKTNGTDGASFDAVADGTIKFGVGILFQDVREATFIYPKNLRAMVFACPTSNTEVSVHHWIHRDTSSCSWPNSL